MGGWWVVLGLVVLLGTLLDVFLTALNYDESGFLAGRVSRWQWRLLRVVTRRLPRRWRPAALRQVTGLQVVVVIVVWLCGVIWGFGLIYYGLMTRSAFSTAASADRYDLFGAMYFSAAQLSTVGGSYLTPETDLLRFLSITETLTGVALVSLILTFLLGVYSVIADLNSLCRQFLSAERGAGSPVASLATSFRDGQATGLSDHLDGIAGSFASYTDGLRLHHAAYYFQSGRDQFALPYALRMLGGTIGALRWGLPGGHPASREPALVPLTFQFLEFGDYLQDMLRWRSTGAPDVVSRERFGELVAGTPGRRDEWVTRFVRLDADMATLAEVPPLQDLDDAYRRYTEWLPFAHRAQQVAVAVGRDLDYQPVILTDRPLSLLHDQDQLAHVVLEGQAAPPPAAPGPPARPTGWRRVARWQHALDRRLSMSDPGRARLRAAGRSVAAAAAAVLSLHLLFSALGTSTPQPAMFGGFVAMLSTGVSVSATGRGRRLTSLVLLVPVAAVVLLGGLASRSAAWTAVLLVAVAAVGAGAARFGTRWAALGQITFVTYYFALLMRLELADVLLYVGAAVGGVAWAYLLNYVVLPERPRRVLHDGVDAFGEHLAAMTDTLVDAVSWGRWDPDVRRRVGLDTRQLQRGAAFLGGQLTGSPEATGLDPAWAAELRLRLFDTELAGVNLVTTARVATTTPLPLELRGRLAGRLQLLQLHLAAIAARPVGDEPGRGGGSGGAAATGAATRTGGAPAAAPLPPWPTGRAPEDWPPAARALHQAADELYRTADTLRTAEASALDPAAPPLVVHDPDDIPVDDGALEELEDLTTSAPEPDPHRIAPTTRRAVQAAIATAAGLAIGEAVSSTHQYWATLAAYQVLGGTDGETFLKGTQRIAGTVAGAAVGFGVALWSGADLAVVVPLLAVAVFFSAYYQRVSPAVSTFWRTMMFAMIYETLGRLTTLALEVRVLETALGAAAALLTAWLVLPTRTRTQLNRDAARLLRDVDVVITATLARLGGDTSVTKGAVEQRLLAIDADVRRLGATAAPLRRAPGALQAGGVEGRLTAFWSLAYFTRHLVRAAERGGAAPASVRSPDWERARAATSQNIAALSSALADRVPGPVQEDLDFDGQDEQATPQARAHGDVLRQLERINLTLVVLVEDVAPGSVGDSPSAAPVPA